MELFSSEFFAALAAIIVIDLALAGDNAIVIALAARNLEPRLRRLAILWGTAGAIGVRAAMTVIVVWLLKIPGLMFLGGLMLLWIAYRLLVPKNAGMDDHDVRAAGGFWAAMGTIIVADATMGLDNVLAVAGAAHGSYLLVVLGLIISIPIVVWGSQLVLRLIDRYPGITYLGAGVLAFTAATMIAGEPYVASSLSDQKALVWLLHVALAAGVLALAFLRTRFRMQDLLEARLLDAAPEGSGASRSPAQRVLVPVDGSANALDAVRAVIASWNAREAAPEVHLVNVRSPLSRHVAAFLRRGDVDDWNREEGLKAMKTAAQALAQRGLRVHRHIRIGDPGGTIAALAEELRCDRIVMGSARKNSLTRLVHDSVTNGVLRATRVPVEVITGKRTSKAERVGVPAGFGAALAILALAAEWV